MKTWVYSWIVYPALYSIAALVGLGSGKVRDTLRLRSWKEFLSLRFNVGHPIDYWVHVASHGELEYALPIIEELGRLQKRVLITYYSISAKGPVELLPRTYPNVSLVVPLPHDGLGLMSEFVSLARKQGVRNLLLMKYELWPGLLWECNAQGIRVLLVDALRPSWFHRRLLHKLDGILSGYRSEVESIEHKNVRVVGDTRVERVIKRVGDSEERLATAVGSELRGRLRADRVLVCGSMWPPDTAVVLEGLKRLVDSGRPRDVIWVPHELDESEAKRARLAFASLGYEVRDLDQRGGLSEKPLAIIVMKKGILAELYRLGGAAFVGGGFGSGVHSVWEPAIAGARVACGPKTDRSPEARELQARGLLSEVDRGEAFASWLDSARSSETGIEDLLAVHRGAAKRIVEICERT